MQFNICILMFKTRKCFFESYCIVFVLIDVPDFFAHLLVCILWAADGRKKKNKWNGMVVLNKSLNRVHLLE